MISRLFADNDETSLASLSNFGVDIREEDDRIIVEADLPGFRKEDVDITLENGTLTIVAERREEITEPPEGQQNRAQPQGQGQGQQQGQQASGQQAAGQQGQQQSRERSNRQSGQYLLRERRIQRVVRSFTLPTNVDEQDVEAKLENGVLRIVLKKREDARPRRVQVA
jgi:HSP20 family protein